MIRHTSGLFIAALFALLASLCAPALSAATVYNVYEYFEGLPADYIPPGGQGYNFRETNPNVTVSPPTFSLGATDIIYNGTTYTCVGWKDGFGVTPDTGSGDSVTFSINSDVAITWIYKSAHRLTLSVAPPGGETRVWGSNDSGQLGDGSITPGVAGPLKSTSWPGFYDWNFLTAGTSKTSAAITVKGILGTWGNNASGQLGNGTITSNHVVQWLPGSYAAVAAGANSTVGVQVDGTLWSWGGAANGQLGDGTTANRSSPKRVVGTDSNWRSVAAGTDFNLALKNDGTLWGWGLNANGQVGVGSRRISPYPPGSALTLPGKPSLQVMAMLPPSGMTAHYGYGDGTPTARWATTVQPTSLSRYMLAKPTSNAARSPSVLPTHLV